MTDDKATKANLKKYLPSICFSGKFEKRFDDKCLIHSGLAILDFDHVENLQEFKAEVCKDKYTFAAFISPSGDGLKVLVKIPADIQNHSAHYLGLIDKYPKLDTTSQNISRVCFISYDPEIYINPESEIHTKKGSVKKTITNVVTPVFAQNTDYAKLNILAQMIKDSNDGNKHHELIKASRLAGGFIAGGMVEEHNAIQVLEFEINKKNISDFKGACKTIQDGIEYGKKEPLYENNYREVIKRIVKEEIIIKEEPAKDIIFLNDVKDKIIYTFQNGTSRGETTHFHDIDPHYRMKRGETTLVYGIGNHGKSQFVYQIALMKSIFDGYKWGVFSPENMPVEEFYKDLIHTFIGKSTEKHHDNQMSMEELEKGMLFIQDHFYLIYPEYENPTPKYMNNRFRELIIKHGIDGCIIDPYNQLDNDISITNGREDLYLSKFLTAAKKFAGSQDVFYFIISHPRGGLKKPQNKQDYDCPDIYDLSGGAMWSNKCDNMLAIHRPCYTSDKNDTSVLFRSKKIKKQKLNGIPGDVMLNFDRNTGRYFSNAWKNPLDTTIGAVQMDKIELKDVAKQIIKPNTLFDEPKNNDVDLSPNQDIDVPF